MLVVVMGRTKVVYLVQHWAVLMEQHSAATMAARWAVRSAAWRGCHWVAKMVGNSVVPKVLQTVAR